MASKRVKPPKSQEADSESNPKLEPLFVALPTGKNPFEKYAGGSARFLKANELLLPGSAICGTYNKNTNEPGRASSRSTVDAGRSVRIFRD